MVHCILQEGIYTSKPGPWSVDWTRDDHYQLTFDLLGVCVAKKHAETGPAQSHNCENSCFLQCVWSTAQLEYSSTGGYFKRFVNLQSKVNCCICHPVIMPALSLAIS